MIRFFYNFIFCSSTSFNCREAVVRFEAKEEEIHSSAAPALVKEDEVPKNEVKEAKEAVVVEMKEEVEEAEQEEKRKKEGRRRRKKHGSEDPEEGAGGHRVVICDDQVVSNFIFCYILSRIRLELKHIFKKHSPFY